VQTLVSEGDSKSRVLAGESNVIISNLLFKSFAMSNRVRLKK
jgi:hypothetical protein